MISPPLNAAIEKILVRGVNWIGDSILTMPSIEALRNLFPKAHLTILVRQHLRSLFEHFPGVDEILTYPQAKGIELLKREGNLIAEIKRGRHDLALIFPRSLRAAIVPCLAGVPYRVGYAANGRRVLLSHSLKETNELLRSHQADYYYQLVRYLGVREERRPPCLHIGPEEESFAASFCEAAGIEGSHTLIALNPGAAYGSAKRWPAEKYIALARRLLTNPGTRLLIIGGSDNASLVDRMCLSLEHNAIAAVGKDLIKLAALLKRCNLLITNDTGPMHIAAAVGTPVVALFGSTDPRTTGPLEPRSRVIIKQTPCSPCLKRRCPYDHRCMEAITVDEVAMTVHEHLAAIADRLPSSIPAVS